jgi:hypothetical protein
VGKKRALGRPKGNAWTVSSTGTGSKRVGSAQLVIMLAQIIDATANLTVANEARFTCTTPRESNVSRVLVCSTVEFPI